MRRSLASFAALLIVLASSLLSADPVSAQDVSRSEAIELLDETRASIDETLALIKAGFSGKPGIAFGLLALAALGGFALLSSHLKGQKLPSALVVGHALLAVAGFVTLLLAQYGLMT